VLLNIIFNNRIPDRPNTQLYLQCSDTVGWTIGRGVRCVKSWVLVCWWWRFEWSFAAFACLTTQVATATSIIL